MADAEPEVPNDPMERLDAETTPGRPDVEAGVSDGKVRAAGGAVWRRDRDGDLEVVLVHRPRYDDWSLPKGKADHGEESIDAALREVAEETGLACTAGAELPRTRYADRHGRPKVVRYWAMTVIGGGPGDFSPNDEIDQVVWLKEAEARARLTYARDLAVLDALGGVAAAG